MVLATKVGHDMKEGGKGLSRAHILKSADQSLARLGTDRIDLYQSHLEDPGVTHEETLSAYAELIAAGKVRAIGASNFGAERLRGALQASGQRGLPIYQSLQPHYNLCEHAGYEKDLEPVCREAGLGVIPYFSLAAGFLTGNYRSEADLAKSPQRKISGAMASAAMMPPIIAPVMPGLAASCPAG